MRIAAWPPAVIAALTLFTGCDQSGGSGIDAGMARGPAGSRLVFDAAMLADPVDAFVPPRDAFIAPPRDSGARTCTGLALSCSSFATSNCSQQRGCRLSGECTGSSRACFYFSYSFDCNDQEGCYWSSFTESCGGSARPCSSMYSSLSCTDQEPCSWRDSCDGVATSCSSLSVAECTLQIGCSLR